MPDQILDEVSKALREIDYGLMEQVRWFSLHGIPLNVGKSLVSEKKIMSCTINHKTYILHYLPRPASEISNEINWNGFRESQKIAAIK